MLALLSASGERAVPHGERRLRPQLRVHHAKRREQRQDRPWWLRDRADVEIRERQLKERRGVRCVEELDLSPKVARLDLER